MELVWKKKFWRKKGTLHGNKFDLKLQKRTVSALFGGFLCMEVKHGNAKAKS